ncbi:hypothetical protein B0T16DRAFT_335165 [Cercophora newfieldiana]|uniref:Uncharacterized protein n=1 Tax=Cercophora newfieldiana TaxID=92897 RepID=A0AA39XYK8_9PEZI|nr:hypothetical protein B0T16DRAFT_335165 [Cercophora newfieldiana]
MCNFTKNYYIYTSCVGPGVHFFCTSIEGSRKGSCSQGPLSTAQRIWTNATITVGAKQPKLAAGDR